MITASVRGPPFRCSGRLSVPLTATLTDLHLYVLPIRAILAAGQRRLECVAPRIPEHFQLTPGKEISHGQSRPAKTGTEEAEATEEAGSGLARRLTSAELTRRASASVSDAAPRADRPAWAEALSRW
jgi:hypothetical protein